jgi:hypothetical protein
MWLKEEKVGSNNPGSRRWRTWGHITQVAGGGEGGDHIIHVVVFQITAEGGESR